jgi:hypothetical protein
LLKREVSHVENGEVHGGLLWLRDKLVNFVGDALEFESQEEVDIGERFKEEDFF